MHIREQMNAFERGRWEIPYLKQSIRMEFWEIDRTKRHKLDTLDHKMELLLY